jgi:hypothetical protein
VLVGLSVEVGVGEGVELGMCVEVGAEEELGEGVDVVVITAVAVGLAILPASFSGCRLQLTAPKINTHPRISPAIEFLNMGQLAIKS